MESFRTILQEGRPVLFDGAMGTELYKKGLFINRCFEEACLSSSALVESVHRSYLEAGAKVLTTNSWGANRFKLTQYTLGDQVAQINEKAAQLAKAVAGESAWVAGSIGPLGIPIEPFGPTSFEEAQNAFAEQALALVKGGADLISLETFSDLSELTQAIQGIRKILPQIPLIANVTVTAEGHLPLGTPLAQVMTTLESLPVDAIGLNCSVGPQPMMTCIEKARTLVSKPLAVSPNAGMPKNVEGRYMYMCTPEYMAHFTKQFFELGVQFVGGCCGTSPEHIRAMSNTLRYAQATADHGARPTTAAKQRPPASPGGTPEPETSPRVPVSEKSTWARRIASGEKVYSVELLPPQGNNPSDIIQKSKRLKEQGIHAINIPDGPRASARMSALLTAVMVERDAEIETVLHYTCRDRNLLGMQSDLLGAQAIGLRNLLLITGDPPKLGDYPDVTGVFDVDAIGLTNLAHRLNGGLDAGGRPIGRVSSLSIGVGVNPVHREFDFEMKRFAWKVQAGAEWAITQPVFDTDALYRFLDYIHQHNLQIPIIAGVWPLVSYRNAVFMNNEVPGVVIPAPVIEQMQNAKTAEDAKKVGVEIAHKMVEKILKDVHGIQVSAPFGNIDLALQTLAQLPAPSSPCER